MRTATKTATPTNTRTVTRTPTVMGLQDSDELAEPVTAISKIGSRQRTIAVDYCHNAELYLFLIRIGS